MLNTVLKYQLVLVSDFGNYMPVVILTFLGICFFLILHKKYKESLLVTLSLGSYPLSALLKQIFKHPRPADYLLHNQGSDFYSFPSSHVLFYTVFFGYIFYLTLKLKKLPNHLRRIAIFITVYMVIMVGISRVYLGAHYVSDVIWGYLFGGVYLALLILLQSKWENTMPKDQK